MIQTQTPPTYKGAKLSATRNYELFRHSPDNRPVDPAGRKDLLRSMAKYGYLPAYPLHCTRSNGNLVITDGQNRFATAQKLGLPVYYVVVEGADISIPEVARTQRPWTLLDFARSFAERGKKDYADLLEFSTRTKLPLSTCIAILSNVTTRAATNKTKQLRDGTFKITTRAMAERVASLYSRLREVRSNLNGGEFCGAIFAACMVKGFEDDRLVAGARACPERLTKYATVAGYLEMLEDAYNYHRTNRLALKFEADNILRQRRTGGPNCEYAK